jgi:hypothetical protein
MASATFHPLLQFWRHTYGALDGQLVGSLHDAHVPDLPGIEKSNGHTCGRVPCILTAAGGTVATAVVVVAAPAALAEVFF